MRLQLTLSLTEEKSLHFDYNPYIQAWIYHILGEADGELATFLHDQGYGEENRQFKFFTFAEPNLYPYKVDAKVGFFRLQGTTIELEVAFAIDQHLKRFVEGLFLNQTGRWGALHFVVAEIVIKDEPDFSTLMTYTTLSPVLLKKKYERDKKEKHLAPNWDALPARDQNEICQLDDTITPNSYTAFFANHLIKNIKRKDQVFSLVTDVEADHEEIEVNVLKVGRSKLIHLSKDGGKKVSIKAYHFTFELSAPLEVHQMIYNAGLGDNCSMGLGCLGVKK